MKDIHWFPGHMKKAKDEIKEKVKLVDVVIEIMDARAPISTRNLELEELCVNKPRLVLLSKQDLSDSEVSSKWVKYYKEQGFEALLVNLNNNNTKQIEQAVNALAKDKKEREKRKGIKPQPVRAMIIGIPNVGKSTLINRLSKTKRAGVENRPGFTRAHQWIKVSDTFELLDTPGILPKKYDDKETSINLALIGSINENILPNIDLSMHLIYFLSKYYPKSVLDRYNVEINNIDDEEKATHVLEEIAKSRGFLLKNGLNIEQASKTLLNEFKNGLLGKISLERID